MLTPPSQPSDDTWRMPLTSEQAALDAVIWSWGECYEIGIDGADQWWYRRRDGKGGRQTARNPDDLRIQITSDYMFLPIRPPPPPGHRRH